jgi:acyl-CoA reductase-like NAD-dependent aldehyde dehydrogenase
MMLAERYPLYLANQPRQPNADLEVTDKATGRTATRVALADARIVDQAITAAADAALPMRQLPAYERQAVLEHCVTRFRERAEDLALVLCIEAGKPLRDARGEVGRLIDTFRIAAQECSRIPGEVLDLEISPRARGYWGMSKRVPIGPCALISPFNFPLNLTAHKIAPAIAAGCPFVLKPASRTPVGALLIGEILSETSLPPGAFSILPASRKDAEALTTDERIKLLSFTGSPRAGWDLKARAGKKKVVLELGSNSACVVDEDADLDDAVPRIVTGAFYQSGQSCISVQRLYAHQAVYERFRRLLVEATKELKMGDPKDPETFIGPMISESEAERLEEWLQEAVSAGARVLCGGRRQGAYFEPTLLEAAPKHCRIVADEAFGPIAVLSSFTTFDEALREVNDSRYGLQAGIFTRDLYKAHKAWNELEVGGVLIGEVPSFRVDHMPYGGVKDSGLGREGIRYAIDSMTEPRLLVVRTPTAQE